MMKEGVKLILGTMTFGEQVFGQDVADMIFYYQSRGYRELDTAYVYNEGACERLIGQALRDDRLSGLEMATKVNPRISGRLDKEAVLSQFQESLACLGLDRVDKLYLHFPDPDTPVEEALEACAQLHQQGKFKQLGLSNFPAWLVAETYHICQSRGWMLPAVYQGLYNPLSRHAERELDAALDHYGMSFYAYNPLAGGILTDRYSQGIKDIKEGRFTNRPNYQARYWKEAYFSAVEGLKAVCQDYDISIVEASYRWLAFHSMLDSGRGDGIILGASRLEQLEENMAAVSKGSLPQGLVEAFQQAWLNCQDQAPEYFRYYKPANPSKGEDKK